MKYYVPKDTAGIIATRVGQCMNLRLILSRYLSEEVIDNKDVPSERGRKYRDKWLKEILAGFHKNNATLNEIVASEFSRWDAITAHENKDAVKRFQMENITRLIVGLGGKGALEFGITLHHVTGLPFIPGSALKGLARSYAFLTLAQKHGKASEQLENFEKELFNYNHPQETDEYNFVKAFGSQEAAGVCQFFDGVLSGISSDNLFTLEVMTPHFVKYYNEKGKTAPHDADNPIPISFVTVSEGNVWAFGIRLCAHALHSEYIPVLQYARKALRAGLTEMGVGSKTSNGYGFFASLK
jgi:CRISPR-associated protein Cmr6